MIRSLYRFKGWLAVASLALAMTSCSRGPRHVAVFSVVGQVILEGKPVPYAFVVLHPLADSAPVGISPRAQADANGAFALSTYGSGDGAPVGDYSVTVQKFRAPTEADTRPPANLLPLRYADPSSSGITVQVHEGSNDLGVLQLKH
jgi:hypothetical protein